MTNELMSTSTRTLQVEYIKIIMRFPNVCGFLFYENDLS